MWSRTGYNYFFKIMLRGFYHIITETQIYRAFEVPFSFPILLSTHTHLLIQCQISTSFTLQRLQNRIILQFFLLCPFQKSIKFSLALHFFLGNNGIFIEMRSLHAYFKVLTLAPNSFVIGSCEISPPEEMLNLQIWCGDWEVVPSNFTLCQGSPPHHSRAIAS